MRLLLIGPPGVGKGTQAQFLAADFGIPHISTGDMLRAAAAAGTEMGKRAKAVMDAGQLVPDEVMIGIVRDVLHSPRTAGGFLLDGFPRTLPQAQALDAILATLPPGTMWVLNLEADDEEIVRRLSSRLVCRKEGRVFNGEMDGLVAGGPCPECGGELYQRDDDKPDPIRKRLQVYHAQTAPLIAYYRGANVVVDVDGMNSIDVVSREIRLLLNDLEGA
jgi:adenylate kinase